MTTDHTPITPMSPERLEQIAAVLNGRAPYVETFVARELLTEVARLNARVAELEQAVGLVTDPHKLTAWLRSTAAVEQERDALQARATGLEQALRDAHTELRDLSGRIGDWRAVQDSPSNDQAGGGS